MSRVRRSRYTVTVSNVGVIYSGQSEDKAFGLFCHCEHKSYNVPGQCFGESVIMTDNGKIIHKHEPSFYEVFVGDIGQIYAGPSKSSSFRVFDRYVSQSKRNRGLAGGQPVFLFQNDDLFWRYLPGGSIHQAYARECFHIFLDEDGKCHICHGEGRIVEWSTHLTDYSTNWSDTPI